MGVCSITHVNHLQSVALSLVCSDHHDNCSFNCALTCVGCRRWTRGRDGLRWEVSICLIMRRRRRRKRLLILMWQKPRPKRSLIGCIYTVLYSNFQVLSYKPDSRPTHLHMNDCSTTSLSSSWWDVHGHNGHDEKCSFSIFVEMKTQERHRSNDIACSSENWRSHSGEHGDERLLLCGALHSVTRKPMIWSKSRSPSSALMIEKVGSSETLPHFCHKARRHIPWFSRI